MLDDLTNELRAYCDAHSLPAMSADELRYEIGGVLDGFKSDFVPLPATDARRQELTEAHKWLGDFCERWEAAEGCAAHGHTDTGRGVCADCGAFLTD